jgi:hypothetical protein
MAAPTVIRNSTNSMPLRERNPARKAGRAETMAYQSVSNGASAGDKRTHSRHNDPRYRGRKVKVVRVEGACAICMCGPRQVKVRLDYIFSDGEPRRSGYSTVAEDGTQP